MKTSRAEVSSALVNFTSLPPLHKLRRQRASYAPSLFAKRASASAQAEIRAPLSNRPTSSSIGRRRPPTAPGRDFGWIARKRHEDTLAQRRPAGSYAPRPNRFGTGPTQFLRDLRWRAGQRPERAQQARTPVSRSAAAMGLPSAASASITRSLSRISRGLSFRLAIWRAPQDSG